MISTDNFVAPQDKISIVIVFVHRQKEFLLSSSVFSRVLDVKCQNIDFLVFVLKTRLLISAVVMLIYDVRNI